MCESMVGFVLPAVWCTLLRLLFSDKQMDLNKFLEEDQDICDALSVPHSGSSLAVFQSLRLLVCFCLGVPEVFC